MKQIFLFDVDGTLTPPRQRMVADFADYFSAFVDKHLVFLVSGSDYAKLCEQVHLDILERCCGVFGCSGAEYVEGGIVQYRKEHEFPASLIGTVERFVENSPYETRCGNHIEHRPGMLNISVVGRQANHLQRQHYHQWDKLARERQSFASRIMDAFPDYEASCGGEISIDIVPAGWNKSVVKQEVLQKFPDDSLVFFGDRMGPQGNDKPLADSLLDPAGRHLAIEVEGYLDTWSRLKEFSLEMFARTLKAG